MRCPTAKTDPFNEKNWNVLTDLLKSGVKACREVCPDARIIIHTEHAGDWDATKNYYMRLRNHAVDYDIIGLSYYPMWHKDIPNLSRTLPQEGHHDCRDSVLLLSRQRQMGKIG